MTQYWTQKGQSIVRPSNGQPFEDNIEMAGRKVAVVVYYGTDEAGELTLRRRIYYPMLRTSPNNTRSSLMAEYETPKRLLFTVDGKEIREKTLSFEICGLLTITATDEENKVCVKRMLFPSATEPAFVEHTVVTNLTAQSLRLTHNAYASHMQARGTKGIYDMDAWTAGDGDVVLEAAESVSFDTFYTGRIQNEDVLFLNGKHELSKRLDLIHEAFDGSIVFESDNPVIDAEYRFAKLRITESIYDTVNGPMHSPGGQHYYAALWANDEGEYTPPFYGFIGNEYAYRATENLMDRYTPFLTPEMHSIPSSLVAECTDTWQGLGDLGDASMCLYGLTRYLLEKGDKATSRRYFYFIDWCARYALTKENEDHLITSNSDELENRLPSGDANLLNCSLTYGGLVCAAYLADELGFGEKAEEYRAFAKRVRDGIENTLGADIGGYRTYAYFKGCDVLRSYICAPLTVGIDTRAAGTADAMLERLWTENGLLSAENNEMFWDRSTLYAFRGMFMGNQANKAYDRFCEYSFKRLLCEHVPYPIEAWPEGNQRHLSGEGGLYARVILEGIVGIAPTGHRRFDLKPSLPDKMAHVKLSKIRAFGDCFTVELTKKDGFTEAVVTSVDGHTRTYSIPLGDKVSVSL